MTGRSTSLAVAAVITLALLGAGPALAAPAFHAPKSEPEQALNRILVLDEKPAGGIDPVDAESRVGRRPRTAPTPGAAYLKYLTVALVTDMLRQEARQVKADCGGVYKPDELCGMDADPVDCAQDFPDHYLFRTLKTGPALAIVEAAWPPDPGKAPAPNGTYRLVLGGGVWKIDGVSCDAGDKYNWKG